MVGRGTRHARKTIERSAEQRAAAGPGAAKHVCRTPGWIECNVVPCYKHVGSLVDGLGRLECELQARIAAANSVYQPLAKKLMSAKHLDWKTKAQLFSSLVLSVLLYGCETWPEPTQSQGKRLEAFQMRCLRRLAGEPRVPIPEDLLRVCCFTEVWFLSPVALFCAVHEVVPLSWTFFVTFDFLLS